MTTQSLRFEKVNKKRRKKLAPKNITKQGNPVPVQVTQNVPTTFLKNHKTLNFKLVSFLVRGVIKGTENKP